MTEPKFSFLKFGNIALQSQFYSREYGSISSKNETIFIFYIKNVNNIKKWTRSSFKQIMAIQFKHFIHRIELLCLDANPISKFWI